MTYNSFILKAKQETISQLENETWYLEPEWKDIICREIESNLNNISDGYLSDWWDVENILRLEVDRRNARDNKKKEVIDWLHETIFATVEPAIMEEETEYIKNVIEYLKEAHKEEK